MPCQNYLFRGMFGENPDSPHTKSPVPFYPIVLNLIFSIYMVAQQCFTFHQQALDNSFLTMERTIFVRPRRVEIRFNKTEKWEQGTCLESGIFAVVFRLRGEGVDGCRENFSYFYNSFFYAHGSWRPMSTQCLVCLVIYAILKKMLNLSKSLGIYPITMIYVFFECLSVCLSPFPG